MKNTLLNKTNNTRGQQAHDTLPKNHDATGSMQKAWIEIFRPSAKLKTINIDKRFATKIRKAKKTNYNIINAPKLRTA